MATEGLQYGLVGENFRSLSLQEMGEARDRHEESGPNPNGQSSVRVAQTAADLHKKFERRPQRNELVHGGILKESSAHPSLLENQLRLQRAQLADNLSGRLLARPGILELVRKNIIRDDVVSEAVRNGSIEYRTISEAHPQSSTAVHSDLDTVLEADLSGSPDADMETSAAQGDEESVEDEEQMAVDIRPGYQSGIGSPQQIIITSSESTSRPPVLPNFMSTAPQTQTRKLSASSLTVPDVSGAYANPPSVSSSTGEPLPRSASSLSAQKSPRVSRRKTAKQRIKRLKYHEYRPPSQGGSKLESVSTSVPAPAEDSAYSLLLQQQTLFLQMQLLNQQYGQQSVMMPDPPTLSGPKQTFHPTLSPGAAGNDALSSTMAEWSKKSVAELKSELIRLGLLATGKKGALIERLHQHLLTKQLQAQQNIDGEEQPSHLDRLSPNPLASSAFSQISGSSKPTSSPDSVGENTAVFKNFLPSQSKNSVSNDQSSNQNLLHTLHRQLLETGRQLQELGQITDISTAVRKLSGSSPKAEQLAGEQDSSQDSSAHTAVKTTGEFSNTPHTQTSVGVESHQLFPPADPASTLGPMQVFEGQDNPSMSRLHSTSVPNSPLGSPHSSHPNLYSEQYVRHRQFSVPQIFLNESSHLHQRHVSCPGIPGFPPSSRSSDLPHNKRLLTRSRTCTSTLATMDENASPALMSAASLPAIPHVPSFFNPVVSTSLNAPPVSQHSLISPTSGQAMGRSVSLNTEPSAFSQPAFLSPQRSVSAGGLENIPAENLTLPADLTTMMSKTASVEELLEMFKNEELTQDMVFDSPLSATGQPWGSQGHPFTSPAGESTAEAFFAGLPEESAIASQPNSDYLAWLNLVEEPPKPSVGSGTQSVGGFHSLSRLDNLPASQPVITTSLSGQWHFPT